MALTLEALTLSMEALSLYARACWVFHYKRSTSQNSSLHVSLDKHTVVIQHEYVWFKSSPTGNNISGALQISHKNITIALEWGIKNLKNRKKLFEKSKFQALQMGFTF